MEDKSAPRIRGHGHTDTDPSDAMAAFVTTQSNFQKYIATKIPLVHLRTRYHISIWPKAVLGGGKKWNEGMQPGNARQIKYRDMDRDLHVSIDKNL
jgi:hypothetical protein